MEHTDEREREVQLLDAAGKLMVIKQQLEVTNAAVSLGGNQQETL